MSLSADYCEEKLGNRDGGALAQQRKLIWGLMVWSTLLTLGLATSIIYFQFIPRASQEKIFTLPPDNNKDTEDKQIIFQPKWGDTEKVEQLQWDTYFKSSLISGETNLTVNKDGHYFLYLQVTLDSEEMGQKYEVTVEVISKEDLRHPLSSHINNTNLSTGFMGKGITLSKGDNITVTCKPKAKIRNDEKHTYLGVIKI